MPDELRERLLASYADMGAAMVIQNVLEVEGIACRVGDLANVPSHMIGMAGGLRRSIGLWVLEADAERAAALLAALGAPESGVDEEALAAEAMAASPSPATAGSEPAAGLARPRPRTAGARRSWFPRAALALLVALAVLSISRGCG